MSVRTHARKAIHFTGSVLMGLIGLNALIAAAGYLIAPSPTMLTYVILAGLLLGIALLVSYAFDRRG